MKWKNTKWYPIEGIGLFNGGAFYETYWHRRWFFKRIKMMREEKKDKNADIRRKEIVESINKLRMGG